ncbi:Ribosomal RNA small subunit methyltransferase I [Frankia canadensis]|uniref:Ribosomal RNA small subunit methyltransferase I n=1 Tax=Frankia canadensis TaxID=1836972 RepID=A0A2I2KQD8_9ACTN|nr:Ribosomal RNA small subunit methyltransferase I [Frankia canadensis]SOU55172.1 Ribosomal RNA small subunit methyltransferase I [Frankia canadensis]
MLCGAPIGDVRDASPRLAEVLATADVIAAEDTRRVLRLAHGLGVTISGRIMSCYDAVEGARAAQLTDYLRQGATVALVTDAGMPAVSDPGFRVVAAAAAAGMTVTVVPGPSAVTAALAVSGLPSDRWTFEGFLPRRGADRRARLRELAGETRTMVFLESPHRLAAGLRDLLAVFGADRAAVLCRELTKTFEEIVRGDLAALGAWATDGRVIRGEFTLVIAGAARRPPVTVTGLAGAAADIARDTGTDVAAQAGAATVSAAALAAEVERRSAAGMSRNQARRAVAAELGVSRNDVYAAELAARPPGPGRHA